MSRFGFMPEGALALVMKIAVLASELPIGGKRGHGKVEKWKRGRCQLRI
jgi:hypothetical protein